MKIFRTSKSESQVWNLVKTIIQTTLFWAFFLFLIPNIIWRLEEMLRIPPFQSLEILGGILFVGFSFIGLYSGYTMSWIGKGTPLPMDCPNKLVISGPYTIVRNPMAVAGIGQGVCVGLILGSFSIILYALVGGVLWHLLVRPIEEADLEKRFGQSYLEYRSKTKCWIPNSL